jgi:hypothetical protein
MKDDTPRIQVGVEFFWLTKFEGDRDPRGALPPLPGDLQELRALCARLQGELYGLRSDLTDPKADEIRAGGDGLRTTTWRRVWD